MTFTYGVTIWNFSTSGFLLSISEYTHTIHAEYNLVPALHLKNRSVLKNHLHITWKNTQMQPLISTWHVVDALNIKELLNHTDMSIQDHIRLLAQSVMTFFVELTLFGGGDANLHHKFASPSILYSILWRHKYAHSQNFLTFDIYIYGIFLQNFMLVGGCVQNLWPF